MKWLLMVVAFVLGVAITWFLTVKRVTRAVPTKGQAAAGVGLLAAEGAGNSEQVEDAADDASRFGGAHTPTSDDAAGAAEAWNSDAEDEDALLSRRSHDVDDDRAAADPRKRS